MYTGQFLLIFTLIRELAEKQHLLIKPSCSTKREKKKLVTQCLSFMRPYIIHAPILQYHKYRNYSHYQLPIIILRKNFPTV